jgi:aldehyde:ferredoxin oxidoreductase
MPYGYNGRVLRVNLSDRKIMVEKPEDILYRRYLGGEALALYYLLRELKPRVNPLDPDNILIFAGSVLNGTPAAGTSRFTVAAKSPLTGAFGEAEAGGWWASELKFAGYDAIIIEGRADRPVYLWVHDGEAEIRDASKIWGLVSGDAQASIREELGDERVRVALIGPAGERMVRFACVINELKHVNARTGMGAVMGSKNLKAVAVRGTHKSELHDRDAARAVARWVVENYKANPGHLHELGTAAGVLALDALGILPTRNFTSGGFEGAEDISGERMADTILVGRGTCYACPIRCKREVQVEEPYQVDARYGGPEYETIAALGSLCGVGDLRAVAKANELCNKYGLDTISTGACIAFAMECYERGILAPKEVDGLHLHFGNAQAMIKLVEMIGEREGFGDLLAEGVARAAAKIGRGAEDYALHVKGQELPMHEPRGKASLTLAYALSPTGADHCEAVHDLFYEKWGRNLRKLAPLGLLEPMPISDLGPKKVRAFYYLQQLWSLYNSLGICLFVGAPIGPFPVTKMVEYLRVVTGWDTSLWELLKVGERALNMARVFNLREGLSERDDALPERLFEPLGGGARRGAKLDRMEFEEAMMTYYCMAGWDPATGIPTRAKLEELGIGWVAELLSGSVGRTNW